MCSLLFLVILCTIPKLYCASVITVEDDGYKGLVVAIHRDVPEDLELLGNIKTLLQRASEFLHNSTRNRLFFKEVKIVIPSTWSQQPEYENLPGNFFSNAHIRVDSPNPEYKDTPYTVQPGGCGEPGQYIHLTPWFLKELHGKTVEMFGAPERQLVHEWAHLRYGVFDEYGIPGDKRYPMFYQEKGRIRPTSCVRDIKGWIESRDGGPCSMTEEGEVDRDCIFIPNMDSNEAKASIMYMPFIPSMEGFCDDENHRHNVMAPTKHNAMCNYRSTWDVIESHNDFKKRSKRDTAENELTQTLFRVIQSSKYPTSRYVLVLDVSGSMNGQPMKLLHGAATRLVEDRVPDGTHLAIVQFSTEARILKYLTKVDNVTRMDLSKSLPSTDDGGRTAIGKGLQEAINVLKHDNGTTEGGLIMLITDGEENVLPYIEDVLPEVLLHNVIINAVAFGSEASQKLENLTAITGGRGYFFSNNGSRPASALDSAFIESITSQADVELQPVQMKDEMFTLDDATVLKHVYVDEELGKETKFTVTSPHINRVADVILRSPSGNIISPSSPYYSREDQASQRIEISLPEAEAGKWEVSIRRIDQYPIVVGFAVSSEPRDIRNQPIRVRSWLGDYQLKFPAYAKVYAEVKKGYLAVIGATVTGTVERPVGPTVDVDLRDDGMGADVTKNDGIYTAYFTHFNGNGRYAVTARVSNDGQARLKLGSSGSASPRIPKSKGTGTKDTLPVEEFLPEDFELSSSSGVDDEEPFETSPASAFDRSSNSGAFRLESWTPNAGDVLPPGDVMDLEVTSAKITEDGHHMVSLTFSMPGDDLDAGQVKSLELRMSKDKKELITNFDGTIEVNESAIVNGSLAPSDPRGKTTLTLAIPGDMVEDDSTPWSIFFAMKGKDDAGKVSVKFNAATANFGIRTKRAVHIVHEQPTEDLHANKKSHHPDDDNDDSEYESGDDLHEKTDDASSKGSSSKLEDSEALSEEPGNNSLKWWPIAVGIGVAIGVIMVVALVAVLSLKKTRVKTYFSVKSEPC